MLSICTTIKNRSKVKTDNGTLFLFPNCIESLAESLRITDKVELIVTDWDSEDWPIKKWIEDALPHFPIQIINIQAEGFSAGKGRNIAAEYAKGDKLFFMDADMLVNRAVIEEGIKSLDLGLTYYPLVKYQIENKGKVIVHEGGGNVFVTKKNFERAGKWPEFWEHGFEDTAFAEALKPLAPVTNREDISIFHQWHPQTSLFKNIHSEPIPKEKAEFKKVKKKYVKQQKEEFKNVIGSIDVALKTNPNTTHSTLYKPSKGKDGRILI